MPGPRELSREAIAHSPAPSAGMYRVRVQNGTQNRLFLATGKGGTRGKKRGIGCNKSDGIKYQYQRRKMLTVARRRDQIYGGNETGREKASET